MSDTHYFVAAVLPQEFKQHIERYYSILKDALPFQRWVHPEDLHLTLAFLGKSGQEQLQKLVHDLNLLLQEKQAFSVTLHGLSTFGKVTSPRVLWCGIKRKDELFSIQKAVYNICTQNGYALDQRPYSPHITLARKWLSEEPFRENTPVASAFTEEFSYKIKIKEIAIYKTCLNRTPKYNPIHKFQLLT
ncbi:RNA 2',3'-cyclic phosphodiesterase [Bacillus sp. HMF5848]|uniref:RNA 2',3'-cyclic phosphodiesterase n=1 Tax=Bacillus sp. HMF5848 TaxID=2495421 RepID=UPI000F7859AB|nr:RNA 2',3'-cyclic phosphodiesterase [Bacillus sp. HMF5848]RSK28225.1 RNA 2',3'-cyclic phosphodiesterase [Bacillus sp. HMF5848]